MASHEEEKVLLFEDIIDGVDIDCISCEEEASPSTWSRCLKLEPAEIEEPRVESPLFPSVSRWLSNLFGSTSPTYIVLFLIFSCSLLGMIYFFNSFMASTPYGTPQQVSCGSNLWRECGVNGVNCLPFESDWYPVRCDPLCSKYKNHGPVVGTGIYRADSDICASATHAGVIGVMGGCFLMRAAGPQTTFNSTESAGIKSYAWNTYFPKSFEFRQCSSLFCVPLQWLLLGVSILTGFILLLLKPKKWVFFFYILLTGWCYIAISGGKDTPHSDYYIGQVFSSLLPSFAIGLAFYKFGKKAILSSEYPLDNLIFYLIPAWITVHWSYLTFFLPDIDFSISSLDSHSMTTVILVLCLAAVAGVFLVLPQLWSIWKTGVLRHYLLGYALISLIVVLVGVVARNHFEFHLHHYLIALFGWPITRFNTRSSALLQAILLGMFINGGARWGFAALYEPKSIVVHPSPPDHIWMSDYNSPHAQLAWNSSSCQAFSLRMNDYEIYRGPLSEVSVSLPYPRLFYHFCVQCIQDGVAGSCSKFFSLYAHTSAY
jgi:hypothetical protein